MKTIRTLFFLCLLSLFTLKVAAQSDYKSGYIVNLQGDTLQGLVSYRLNMLHKNVIGFKDNEQAVVINYTPTQIASYGFPNDKNFQAKLLDHADTLAAEHVFMEELVRGSISLYNYQNNFFVEKQGEKLQKLYTTYVEYYNSSGSLAKRQVNHHISTLNMLMQDCFKMLQEIERVKLVQKNLVELVQKYNNCTDGGKEQIIFKEKKPWIAAQFGIVGGIKHTSLNFSAKDEEYLHLENGTFNTNTYPSFGLALNLSSPRITDHTSIQLEGQYFKNHYDGQSTYTWFGPQYHNEMEFNLTAIQLDMSVRHDFSGKTFQPFANVGTFFNLYQKREFKHMQYVKRTSASEPEERTKDDPMFIGKRQQGLLAGIGSYINLNGIKLSTEIRYEYGFDIHTHNAVNKINNVLNSNTKTATLLVGVYF